MKINSKNIIRVLSVLICLALLIYGIWYFAKPAEEPSIKPDAGRWRTTNNALEDRLKDIAKNLSSLPYLQGYNEAPLKKGVTIYDSNLAYDGLNFYCSGHAPEAGIMDMRGNVLHKWTYNFEDLPTKFHFYRNSPSRKESSTHWRRAYLYENGDILAIYDSIAMIKLDKDSNLLAVLEERIHHHMQVIENGNVYALLKKRKIIPWVVEDFIVCIDPNLVLIDKYRLLKSFKNSSYAHILEKMPTKNELFHTNTIQVFDGELAHISPLFKKGNVLISVLFLNTIAIVDLEKNQVVWALEGKEHGLRFGMYESCLWFGMHEPVLLNNGNILIFDNDWREAGVKGQSKVTEFNPFTKQIVWQYKGNKEHPFYSRTCGTNQRLPNGNTLITESDNGRAFEVTKDGKIVWEYINPHRAGQNNELIATLLHVHRIDRNSAKWLAPGL